MKNDFIQCERLSRPPSQSVGTIVRSSVIFCFQDFFKRFFKLGLGVGLGLGLGLGIVLGLGLGTGLALGLRVGWVLCITTQSCSN